MKKSLLFMAAAMCAAVVMPASNALADVNIKVVQH